MYKNIIEDINEPVLEGMVKTKPITNFFNLDIQAEKIIRDTGYEFGFGLLSDSVFNRTYSRKDNGISETFPDVIIRVVKGIMSIRKNHYINSGFSWDDLEWRDWAINIGVTMMKMQCLPPGRGLYVCGTDFSYKRGGSAFNNCGFCSTKGGLVKSATWMMDSSMCGCGIGFDTELDENTPFYLHGCAKCRLLNGNENHCNCENDLYVIHDSREGWVKSLNLLLKSYCTKDANNIHFDYSKLRPKGAKIVGFGGVSSGSKPLEKLHKCIRGYFECYEDSKTCPFEAAIKMCRYENDWGLDDNIKIINELKEKHDILYNKKYELEEDLGYIMSEESKKDNDKLSNPEYLSKKKIEYTTEMENVIVELRKCTKTYGMSRLIVDIFNAIGVCVVAGNVRRSSEIALGSNSEFRLLKNFALNPERQGIAHMSNNSVSMKELKDFESIPDIAEQIKVNGEPGILNHLNLGTYGRIGKKNKIGREAEFDHATGINPCLTADTLVSTVNGMRTIKQLIGKQFETTVVGEVAASDKRGFWSNGVNDIFELELENGMKVRATGNHRFLHEELSRKEWRTVDETIKGSKIYLSCDSKVKTIDFNKTEYCEGYICAEHFSSGSTNNDKNVLPIIDGLNCQRVNEELLEADNIDSAVMLYMRINSSSKSIRPGSITCPIFEEVWKRFDTNDVYETGTLSFNIGFLKSIVEKKTEPMGYKGTTPVMSLTRIPLVSLEKLQRLLVSIDVVSEIETVKNVSSLNIYGMELVKLKKVIGFQSENEMFMLQKYSEGERMKNKSVLYTSAVKSIISCGKEEVYDCSIPGINMFGAGGLVSHNCGEISLEGGSTDGSADTGSGEFCNISEVFLPRCDTEDEMINAAKVATFYCSTVSLLPTHWSGTNKIIARNRRIGVGLGGIADFYDRYGLTKLTTIMKMLYKEVRMENKRLAKNSGVNSSLRVTTVKPSGSVSLLTGSTPGIHFPTFSRAIRNVRFASNSEVAKKLIDAGVYYEQDIYDKNTLVFSFPMSYGNTRAATDVSIWEQAAILKSVQRNYSDNSVSVTLYFAEHESKCVADVIADTLPHVKSLSILPHTPEGVYAQSPFVRSTDEEYQRLMKNIKTVDWSDTKEQGLLPSGCDSSSCEISSFKLMVEDANDTKEETEPLDQFKISFDMHTTDLINEEVEEDTPNIAEPPTTETKLEQAANTPLPSKKRKMSFGSECEELDLTDIPKPQPLSSDDRSPLPSSDEESKDEEKTVESGKMEKLIFEPMPVKNTKSTKTANTEDDPYEIICDGNSCRRVLKSEIKTDIVDREPKATDLLISKSADGENERSCASM